MPRRGIANYGQLTVRDSRIVDNTTTSASGFAGGGILNYGTLTVQRSTIAGNETDVGGGIYGHGGASTTILDSTLSDNFARDSGGGIYTIGELTVVNSTLSGNRAIGDGGGIADFTGDRIALTNVTVVFNQADADGDGVGTGGGLRVSGDTVLHNSIVAGNTRGTGSAGNEINGVVHASSSHNLIGTFLTSSDAGGMSPANGNLYVGNDVHLGPLADNGGQTKTHALLPRSSAIDAGSNLQAVLANLTTDQRGENRYRDGGSGSLHVDIGAYEAVDQPKVFVVTTELDEDDGGLGLGQGDSLREVIQAANENVGADTIVFNLPAQTVVTIAAGLPAITDELVLRGPGTNALIVQSSAAFRTIGNDSTLEVSGLSFQGLRFANWGELVITDSVISENKCLASFGFGCIVGAIFPPGQVIVSGIAGGAIFNDGTLILRRSTVSNNADSGGGFGGGGIYNGLNGTATIVDSTISENESSLHGAGIHNSGQLTILNSTISGNQASGSGGGIYNLGTVQSVNATIAFNDAENGGGVSGAAGVTLRNSIVAENIGGELTGMVEEASSYNMIGITALNSGPTGLSPQKGNIFVDRYALLGPLADNGGSTWTHALLPGSPAIDRGSNANAAAANLSIDQRGEERFRDGGSGAAQVDIGAYEASYVPSVLVVTTTADEDNGGLGLGQGDSLREVLAASNHNVVADTIEFALPAQSIITLTQPLPWVEGDLTVSGPGASQLTVQSDGVSRSLTNQAVLDLAGLTLRGVRVSNSGTLTISEAVVTDNLVTSVNGGGIYNSGTLTLLRSTVSNNQASAAGGGIFNQSGATATVRDSTISGNASASEGGGIANLGALTLLNSTISGNQADGQGGGIHDSANDPVLLVNVTVSNNTSSSGIQGAGGDFYQQRGADVAQYDRRSELQQHFRQQSCRSGESNQLVQSGRAGQFFRSAKYER